MLAQPTALHNRTEHADVTSSKHFPVSVTVKPHDSPRKYVGSRFGTPEEEAADELLWEQEFRDNSDAIAAMADKALQDYEQGKTVPLERVLIGKR